eukprot:2010201-Rhodomonas_salina.1
MARLKAVDQGFHMSRCLQDSVQKRLRGCKAWLVASKAIKNLFCYDLMLHSRSCMESCEQWLI